MRRKYEHAARGLPISEPRLRLYACRLRMVLFFF